MQLQTPFDATQWNPAQSSGSLPVGKHPVIISDSIVKANSKNDGGFLELTLTITDGPQAGCTGPYRLNLYNQSQQAVEIAHKQLSAICHVVGIFNIQDSAQLHNIPFIVEVGVQKNDPQYTEVKKVFDRNGNEPGKQNAAPAAAPVQQQPQQQQFAPPASAPVQQAPAAAPPWGASQQAAPPVQQQGPASSPPWGQPAAPNAAPVAAPPWGASR